MSWLETSVRQVVGTRKWDGSVFFVGAACYRPKAQPVGEAGSVLTTTEFADGRFRIQ